MAEDQEQGFQMPVAGPEHQLLSPFEGTFTSEVKLWMGPGDPMVSTGTMTNSFKLDGLYLYQDYVGDKVDGPFPSFKGQGYWGFNTSKGEYEGFWIDNASTMMQMEAGAVDADGKVWEMHSEFLHPGSGESMKKKTIITLIDGDHHKMETFFVSDGQPDFKNMEINYTRKS